MLPAWSASSKDSPKALASAWSMTAVATALPKVAEAIADTGVSRLALAVIFPVLLNGPTSVETLTRMPFASASDRPIVAFAAAWLVPMALAATVLVRRAAALIAPL